MRVSSSLRIEASKLFWGDPNTYYLIESDWIFDGGYPGNTHYEQSFFPYVQNIEVQHLAYTDDKIAIRHMDGESDIQHHAVRDFWDTLKRRFPTLKYVIFNQNGCSVSDRKHNKSISYCLQILIRSCPPNINVSVDVLEYDTPVFKSNCIPLPTNVWQRSLYQPMVGGQWGKVIQNPTRKTIFIPTRMFTGPVGEFENIRYTRTRQHLQYIALSYLIIEAIDRHHFDKERPETFSCLEPGCNVYFEKAGQCTLHALRARTVYMMGTEPIPEYLIAVLPKVLGDEFRGRQNQAMLKVKDLNTEIKRMSGEWNKEGGRE
jgi:hypothetical protein